MHYPPRFENRTRNTHELSPLPASSQPYGDVLFINSKAPAHHLFEAATQRMTAVCDLLCVLEGSSHTDVLPQQTARLASALGLLLADARALHEAAYQRLLDEQRPRPARKGPAVTGVVRG
ncbi:hypothetical protein ACUTAH_06025 [Metapseudomonas furukawaii]|uniref:hypothetical protein n=1 Tax=Metapseudomonas furukawaii TaxID=1149133 RepID=UPI0040459AE2